MSADARRGRAVREGRAFVLDPAERRILVFASASHFLTHFFMLVFPALVIPISRDLGIPVAQALTISFWSYLLYGLLSLGWGFISDHLGHRWAMSSGMILGGIGLVLAGTARSFVFLSVAFALVGVGCAAYHPSGTALVSQGVRQRGRALGINGIWGNAGIASTPFVVGVLGFVVGWRVTLEILGAFGVVLGLLALAVPLSVPRGSDRAALKRVEGRAAILLFSVFCIGLVFGGFMYRGFTLILPSVLETRLGPAIDAVRRGVSAIVPAHSGIGLETLTADIVASVVYLVGMLGQTLGGRIADRYSLKWAYFFFFLAALPFILGASLADSIVFIPLAGFYVFFSLGMQPIENSMIAALTPPRWRSMSYGVKFTLSFAAGSFAVQLMSVVGSRYGIASGLWVVVAALALVILNMVVFLVLSRGREVRQ